MRRIIYGAGKYGQKLNSLFLQCGIKVDFFAQTTASGGRLLDSIPVISFDDMLCLDGDLLVFLAIKDKTASEEILAKIQDSRWFGAITVIDSTAFIESNPVITKSPDVSSSCQCNICGNRFARFNPAGKEEGLIGHHVIGAGYRNNCFCPVCLASDRYRWLYYVLKNVMNICKFSGRVLHFAPEPPLERLIQLNQKLDYYTVDIEPGRAMHIADITDLRQFSNGTFDLVICNHVMEHIPDERKAVAEVKRMLKNGGKWVFSFPICTDIEETYEDESIDTPEKRLKAYGQKDHVRLYGRDYLRRFESYGLKITEYSPKDYFSKDDIEKFGFIEDDVIMVAEKN